MTETKQIHKIKPQGESFADLAEELFLWAKEETFPQNVSADAARILQAQRQRLREKGLEMEYAMTSQDFFSDAGKQNSLFLHWLCEGDIIFRSDRRRPYKLLKRLRLQAVARYQGRGYLIHQLYFQREHGSDWKRSFRRILKCFGIGAGAGFVVSLYRILALNSLDYASLLVDPLVGALLLYVVYAVGQLGKLLVESVRTMPLIRRSGQTRMEITSVMQLLNHDFSFHEFEAELINLLQRVLFEKDISDIAQYEPEAREGCLGDIIYSEYTGMMIFRGYHSEESVCTLHVDLYMQDVYMTGGRFRQRRDLFHITVRKDLSAKSDRSKRWSMQAMWREA